MPDIRSILAERHVTVSSATPSHSDVVVGSLWVDSDDSKFYICTSVGPIVFTEYSFVTDNYVTNARLADMAVDTVKGRVTAGTGDPEDVATTGSGNVVRATSPTLVTPALGTPASGVLTNVTGLPTAGMVDGAVTLAKMANLVTNRLIGRVTDSTGAPEAVVFSDAGQALVDDADADAQLTTLGGAAPTGTGGLARATAPTFTTITGSDATDATSITAGAMKTAGGLAVAKKGYFGDLVDITKSGSPQEVTHKATNGPHASRMVGAKNGMTDNTLTSFLTVTIPNNMIGGTIRLDYMANSDNRSRWRMGGLFIFIARAAGATTQKSSIVYITEQTLLAGSAETLTVTFTLSANTGAVDAAQTFDIQVTIDSDLTPSLSQIHYVLELVSDISESNTTPQITIAAV